MKVRCLLIGVVVMFVAGMLTAPGYAMDAKNIVGMWLFDEVNGDIAKDSSGNGNDGKLMGGPKWVAGMFGSALEFDGTDDYVIVNYNSSLKLGNNGAISVWFKPSALEPGTHNIITYGGGDYSKGFLLNQSGPSKFNGYWKTPGPAVTVDPAFSVGDWFHLVLTNDEGNLKVYLNGEEKGTGSSGGSITDDKPIYIGGATEQWRSWMFSVSGIIDDIVIFNVNLEEEDIQTLMEKGLKETFNPSVVDLSGKLTTTWAAIKAR